MSREEGEVRVEGAALASPVVDTTGAGDAFVGSLAYFLARRPGMALQEMVSHVLHTNRNTNQLTISLPTNKSINQQALDRPPVPPGAPLVLPGLPDRDQGRHPGQLPSQGRGRPLAPLAVLEQKQSDEEKLLKPEFCLYSYARKL